MGLCTGKYQYKESRDSINYGSFLAGPHKKDDQGNSQLQSPNPVDTWDED